MAGYRPKSLEELNSLYDKSLNIKNEIDRKASDLEVKQEIYTPASVVVPKADAVQEIAAEETATRGKFHQGNFKYIAYYINMFIIYKLVDIKYIMYT